MTTNYNCVACEELREFNPYAKCADCADKDGEEYGDT